MEFFQPFLTPSKDTDRKLPSKTKGARPKEVCVCFFACKSKAPLEKLSKKKTNCSNATSVICSPGSCRIRQMKPSSINLCSRTALPLRGSHSHWAALTCTAQKSSRKSSSHSTPSLLQQRCICSTCKRFLVKLCRGWHHKVTAGF